MTGVTISHKVLRLQEEISTYEDFLQLARINKLPASIALNQMLIAKAQAKYGYEASIDAKNLLSCIGLAIKNRLIPDMCRGAISISQERTSDIRESIELFSQATSQLSSKAARLRIQLKPLLDINVDLVPETLAALPLKQRFQLITTGIEVQEEADRLIQGSLFLMELVDDMASSSTG